jgi:hypothetical protein
MLDNSESMLGLCWKTCRKATPILNIRQEKDTKTALKKYGSKM